LDLDFDERVDHVFGSPAVRTKQCRCCPEQTTDQRAIVVHSTSVAPR